MFITFQAFSNTAMLLVQLKWCYVGKEKKNGVMHFDVFLHCKVIIA